MFLFKYQPSALSDSLASYTEEVSSPNSQIPPEGLLAKALYPWKARQETDLSFDKDDTILVREQQDLKWYGEFNGKVGAFTVAINI